MKSTKEAIPSSDDITVELAMGGISVRCFLRTQRGKEERDEEQRDRNGL